ncbi:MAG: DUF305 domain-containing protein [Jatrophihabitans sp.]|uniref:DUF305 domain-containing protein n=1 Tax=Jatrophihabitans sp. TaxID=1932789 RepID=UPI003F8079C7
MRKTLAVTGATFAAAAAITLSACSSSGSSHSSADSSGMPGGHSMSGMSMSSMPTASGTAQAGAPATGPHNAGDVTFATDMIPHHAQALAMAKMALTKAASPKVKQLAQRIENEQSPEISLMSGWLKGWNKPVPDTTMGGMDMGSTSDSMTMPGMMSAADMAKLNSATGSTFDKLFLSQMITHHTGAITMANTELTRGQNGDAKTLAKSIIAGQSNEITEMKALLPTIK